MKSRQLRLAIIPGALLLASPMTEAALIDRGGGMIYDTAHNITWLADANYAQTSGHDADGLMDWYSAVEWTQSLVYGGHDDWRLPTSYRSAGCSGPSGDLGLGFDCTGSEMGNLFYNELGGQAGDSILTSTNANVALFRNIQANGLPGYWSTKYSYYGNDFSYFFRFSDGYQASGGGSADRAVWAVRNGDVTPVPLPASAWLLMTALISLGAALPKLAAKTVASH